MSDFINDAEVLESTVGKLPGPRDLKVIDFLDDNAIRWIAASPFLFAALGDANDIAATAAGGAPGFVGVDSPGQLSLPMPFIDDAALARVGQGFGSLFLVPGIEETLRVNGRVREIANDRIIIAVDECYLHCAKAFMRSDFWAAQPRTADMPADPIAHLDASRFMALATIDAAGRADLSPKGDPAGALLKVNEGNVYYPDRPGNRRVDSFRNILTQPRVAAMALIPGAGTVVSMTGNARITTDEVMRTSFTVNEKTPKIVTRIEQAQLRLRTSEALLRARLWPAQRTAANLDPADIFKAHVKLNRIEGVSAAVARAAVSIPGLMRKGLDNDYKKNLY